MHDLTIHPRENDLVLGTYGRGIFVGDITPLQELSAEVIGKPFHLFAPEPRTPYNFRAPGQLPPLRQRLHRGARTSRTRSQVTYYLRAKADSGARITMHDIKGEAIAQLKGPSEAGINRVPWNMRAGSAAPAGRGGRGGGPTLPPGDYRITVEAGGQTLTTIGRIRERIGAN